MLHRDLQKEDPRRNFTAGRIAPVGSDTAQNESYETDGSPNDSGEPSLQRVAA